MTDRERIAVLEAMVAELRREMMAMKFGMPFCGAKESGGYIAPKCVATNALELGMP